MTGTAHRPPGAAMLFIVLAVASGAAAETGKVKQVPLTSLGKASIRISFGGTIKLTGTTKSLTYSQPLPAEDGSQSISSLTVAPSPGLAHELIEDAESRSMKLTWTDPPAGEIEYAIEVMVDRRAFDHPIASPKKGSFKKFLKSGALTKPDAAIKKQAKELAQGSSSDLETILRLARWINENITYDRDYSQNKVDKKVPSVMAAMRGTCDELSHLFIAMARSVSIPAREVSGLAFTGEVWGFHSWSEVRLGDAWVPVDATNFQVGFVDATHVAFARHGDDAKFEQHIESLGTGMFSVLDHDMDVRIMKASTAADMLKAEMIFEPETVPPGLGFKARLVLENPSNSWFAGPARLVVPAQFEVTEDVIATYVLAPGAHETIEWSVATPQTLDQGATYWYRMGAVLFPHQVAASKLTVAAGLIDEVAAFQDAGGSAVVALGIKNPLGESHPATVEICMYDSWELEGEPLCQTGESEVAAGDVEKLEFETTFAITGNFAIAVKAALGGLVDERIHKVNVSASP
ncbi:MAG: transglutaminase domain-containing protein [Deltaproteobacteria bacterium]|nr:transglutaminase domain-containing protein [Deltaproteobacteria bacterium]